MLCYNQSNEYYSEIIFIDDNKCGYDLTFFKRSAKFIIYRIENGIRMTMPFFDNSSKLSDILDYLKLTLTEEQFSEVQKFCFNYI